MFWWEPRLIVGAQLERVSWAAGASAVIYIRGCDGITKRDVSGWRGNTGEGTREKMMLESLPEAGRAEMDER